MDVFDAIFSRRSVGRLQAPGPSDEDLRRILEAAAAAPDHGSLRPFRFVVLAGSAKDRFGEVLASAYLARCRAGGVDPIPAKEEKERTKLGRAPVVVVVGAARVADDGKIPFAEQEDAAAAACQNALLAATALGYGSMWRTGDPAYDPMVKEALGLSPDDAIVGFLYLGTAGAAPERRVPDLDGLVTEWTP
jgi:nitroreductase